jgi:hypothetical protein
MKCWAQTYPLAGERSDRSKPQSRPDFKPGQAKQVVAHLENWISLLEADALGQ